jgi:hypothetical protein
VEPIQPRKPGRPVEEGEPLDLPSSIVTVHPAKMRLVYSDHWAENESVEATQEYRLRGTVVQVRLLEQTTRWADREPMELTVVADGVVIESAIRDAKHFGSTMEETEAEEEIAEFRAMTEWQDVRSYELRFYVLAHHPELLPPPEFRQAVRAEIERVRNGTARVIEVAIGLGIHPVVEEGNWNLQCPDGWSGEQRAYAGEQIQAAARANGLASTSEAMNAPTMISDLEGWLDRVRA